MGQLPSKPDPSRKLEVIGAGLSRTGTLSQTLAFEKLLNGPSFHGASNWLYGGDLRPRLWWEAAQARRAGDKERMMKLIKQVTAGYVAGSDIPFNMFVPELLELYPDAKVVLVKRDPEKWWKSMSGNLHYLDMAWVRYLTLMMPGVRWTSPMMDEWKRQMNELMGGTNNEPVPLSPVVMETHYKWVVDCVPKDKLLVMEITVGWAPLCKFLEKPVPDEPFSKTNEQARNARVAAKWFAKAFLTWVPVFSAMGYGLYVGWSHWQG